LRTESFDVFISYARVDSRHAADIDSLLRARGLSCFFDRRGLVPGLPWVRGLEQALNAARAATILVGPHGLGNTQQYERDFALIRQTGDPSFPIVPVLLPGADRPPGVRSLEVSEADSATASHFVEGARDGRVFPESPITVARKVARRP
jgi:hypothetical protein